MTPHFWQQTQNYITTTLGENVAIEVLILGWQKWQNPAFFTIILMKCAFFDKRKMTLLVAKSFGAYTSPPNCAYR